MAVRWSTLSRLRSISCRSVRLPEWKALVASYDLMAWGRRAFLSWWALILEMSISPSLLRPLTPPWAQAGGEKEDPSRTRLRKKHRQKGQKVWMMRIPFGPLMAFFLSSRKAVLTEAWVGNFQLALTWAMRAVRRFLAATFALSFSSLGLLFFHF